MGIVEKKLRTMAIRALCQGGFMKVNWCMRNEVKYTIERINVEVLIGTPDEDFKKYRGVGDKVLVEILKIRDKVKSLYNYD